MQPQNTTKRGPKPKPRAGRFWSKVNIPADPTACWEWQGTKTRKGYGQLGTAGRAQYAHRVSWELHNGTIPNGLIVCHRCDNPPCVNPTHLFLGSYTDNLKDALAKHRHCPPPALIGERWHLAHPHNGRFRIRKTPPLRCAFSLGPPAAVAHSAVVEQPALSLAVAPVRPVSCSWCPAVERSAGPVVARP